MKEIVVLLHMLRKISNLESLPKALARPQLLQGACSFEINNPSGNFFSGPRLTARERELILDWTPEKSWQSCLGPTCLVSLCLAPPEISPWTALLGNSAFFLVASPRRNGFTWAVVGTTSLFPRVSPALRLKAKLKAFCTELLKIIYLLDVTSRGASVAQSVERIRKITIGN